MTSAGDHLVDFEAGQLSALAGFSPLRTLTCISSAFTKYSALTPNRPEATCLIALRAEVPSGRVL